MDRQGYTRGDTHESKVIASWLQYAVLGCLFVFVGQMDTITCRHLPPQFESLMTRRLPLIRPDGYKGLVMILPTKLYCSPDCVNTCRGPFVFRAPQGSSTSNFPIMTSRWWDQNESSENPARPKPFVSTVFEDCFSRIAYLYPPPERGVGLSISRTSVERGSPFRFFFSTETRVGAVELGCSRVDA